ncbi:hypothetical protein [Streptomyces sp. NPDC059398]|uniref:hypothetical protein n=1 Tax=Streptomyces sp. NPDC059398 TaxID=3346820 RepID=UPI00367E44BD
MTRHGAPVDVIRGHYAARAEGSQDIRDWVGALVRPVTDHWPPSAPPPGTPACPRRS